MQHSNNSIIISIRDLGCNIQQIRTHWQELLDTGKPIQITEFPNVDFCQSITKGHSLMSLILDMAAMIQEQQRREALHRQAIGIQNAREKGIRLGRKPLVIPEQFHEIADRVVAKKMTVTVASRELGVDYKTFRKWMKESREAQEES